MITRYTCAIDGQGLQDIDPTIVITDIQESSPKLRTITVDNALYDGQRILRRQRQSLAVSVTFCVREYDTERRKAVAEKACDWAHDGWLTINDRPGQRLYVVCDKLPVITSALKWTDKLTIGFTAYALPYWQAANPVTASFSGMFGGAPLTPTGTEECFLEADIYAINATLNTLTISVNDRRFALENIGLRAGQTLSIGYDDEHHLQYMRIGDDSVISKRTADSDDDLMLRPRSQNRITVTANTEVRVTFRARGLWR